MKTSNWLAIMLCVISIVTASPAQALQSSVDKGLNITVAGIRVGETQYEAFLTLNCGTSSTFNWVFHSLEPTEATEQLPYVNSDMGLVVPNLLYQGSNYRLQLDLAEDTGSLSGGYWCLNDMVETAQSATIFNTQASAPESDIQSLAQSVNRFSFELYRKINSINDYANESFLFSPYEISRSLGFVYAGAANQTASQMASALQYNLEAVQLHPAYNALTLEITGHGGNPANQANGALPVFETGYRITTASLFWAVPPNLYPILMQAVNQEYLDLLAFYYGIGVYGIDPDLSSEEVRAVINRQMERKTGSQFAELISGDEMASEPRMILSDGLFFEASWHLPFDRGYTDYDYFYNSDGSQNFASFMYQKNEFSYYSGSNFQAVELFYSGKDLSMVLILPHENELDSLEDSLDADSLDTILSGFEEKSLQIRLPKWEFSNSIDLALPLKSMGMTDLFSDEGADLSQIFSNGAFGINQFNHGAYIQVDENGTKAGAWQDPFNTGALDVIDIRFNRPFIYLIRDADSGAVLFLGRLMSATSD